MDKFDATQLDLFAQNQNVLKRPAAGAGFLMRLRLYERTILFVIGFIITAIIAFALGVEQGRRRVSVSQQAAAPVKQVRPQAAPAAVPPVALAKAVPAVTNTRQSFTIQIASFKSRDFAQQEATVLRKLGYTPVFVTSGSYVVLCVGTFSDKESAKPVLAELTKKYQGCYLRRI